MKNRGLLRWFLISTVIAAASFALVFFQDSLPIGLSNKLDDLPLYISLCGSGVWILLVVLALRAYGRRGLWLLIGMPLALCWPSFLALFALGYIKVVI
jgi:hypothetical protein